MPETLLGVSEVLLFGRLVEDLEFKSNFSGYRQALGDNAQLKKQFKDGQIARIYGFSFEGTYYELPNPTLFLVHGDGQSVTDGNEPTNPAHASRAPLNPSDTGVAAADFQFADDIMFWHYDKGDFTVRMDVSTGMIEDILLASYFAGGGPRGAMVSGAMARGAMVSGAMAKGAMVSGAMAKGAMVSGNKIRGSGD